MVYAVLVDLLAQALGAVELLAGVGQHLDVHRVANVLARDHAHPELEAVLTQLSAGDGRSKTSYLVICHRVPSLSGRKMSFGELLGHRRCLMMIASNILNAPRPIF